MSRKLLQETINRYARKHRNTYGKTLPIHNEPVCSFFGCGKHLGLFEILAGGLCTHHMNTKPINITQTIKHP